MVPLMNIAIITPISSAFITMSNIVILILLLGLRCTTPTMGNHMEKNMEHAMKTTIGECRSQCVFGKHV